MEAAFPGLGTAINAVTVVLGSLLGMGLGHRLRSDTRAVVTDCLGLVTLLMAALSAAKVTDPAFVQAVGGAAPTLIVLGSLLLGGIAGSLLGLQRRLETVADRVQAWLASRSRASHAAPGTPVAVAADADTTSHAAAGLDAAEADTSGALPTAQHRIDALTERERFIEGWLTATLLFCVGPLTILGALSDGLGRGIDQLVLKSVLDGFASIAFAASFGIGVLMSAVSVIVIQGSITLLGVLLGSVMPEAHIAALTATGGLMLVGIALRLLRIKDIAVGDLLPALLLAPLLTQLVVAFR